MPGPAVILELLASTMIDCYHGYHVCPRMFFGDDVAKITSRKLYVCLMKCNVICLGTGQKVQGEGGGPEHFEMKAENHMTHPL